MVPALSNSLTRQEAETHLAAAIERLRLAIEQPDGPALPDDEVRRRVDAIADLFLALYGDAADAANEPARP